MEQVGQHRALTRADDHLGRHAGLDLVFAQALHTFWCQLHPGEKIGHHALRGLLCEQVS